MKGKTIMRALALVLLPMLLSAQTQSLPGLSGLVYDLEIKPVTAVSVQLCTANGKLLQSTLSDAGGRFAFSNLEPSSYLLRFSHLSYSACSLFVSEAELKRKRDVVVLMDGKAAIALDAVQVSGRRPEGRLLKTNEGFAFNVAPALKTLSIWETLKQVPLLSMRDNTELSIAGKGGSQVLINGRKTNLSGSDLSEMLKNMTADNLLSVEIITSPSSKYEAQGGGGIINLKLQKKPAEGLWGTASASYELSKRNSALGNTNYNYSAGAFSSQLGLRAAINKNLNLEDSETELYKVQLNNKALLRRLEKAEPLGLFWINSYDFTDKHNLSVQTNLSRTPQELDWTNLTNYSRSGSTSVDSTTSSHTLQDARTRFITVDIYDRLQLDTLGSSFSAGLSFFRQSGINQSPYEVSRPGTTSFFEIQSRQRLRNVGIQVDYTKSFSKSVKVELGGRFNQSKSSTWNRFLNEGAGLATGGALDENDYLYREQILAFYSSLGFKLMADMDAVLGARLERTEIEGSGTGMHTGFERDYTNLFPNVSLVYSVKSGHQLSLNVNSRINRPAFWELNPTPVYLSPWLYTKGNAFLVPSRTFNSELSYVLNHKLVLMLSHSKQKDDWMQFQTEGETAGTVVYDRFNYGKSTLVSMLASYYDHYFNERLRINTSLTGARNSYEGKVLNRSLSGSGWQWNYKWRGDIDIGRKKKAGIYASFVYYSPVKSAQGRELSIHYVDAGAIWKHKKLNVQLGGRDIFNTGLAKFTMDDRPNAESYTVLNSSRRRLVLSASYAFGKQKAKSASTPRSASQEEKNRM